MERLHMNVSETTPRSKLPVLRAGNLEVRLALSAEEIDAAQALRYRVFYQEMAAHPSPETARTRRDADRFDSHCDHLLVIDHSRSTPADYVVGTYRLLRRAAAAQAGGFYSASEYDISKLKALPGEILELGRSCVDAGYRNRPTMQLMWRGIAAYVFHHQIEVMFGCASLPGTDVQAHADVLSYLYHYHLAPPALRPRALDKLYVNMKLRPQDAIDARASLATLPPLVKGYLRLGGFIGDGAVIDDQFNTVDVCVVVKTDLVTEKYLRHYEILRESSSA
jgi:putative hemolysin